MGNIRTNIVCISSKRIRTSLPKTISSDGMRDHTFIIYMANKYVDASKWWQRCGWLGVGWFVLMGEWCENDNTQNTDDITSIADY